jgi:organic hydroperoxide reductase OsmC/OhrA
MMHSHCSVAVEWDSSGNADSIVTPAGCVAYSALGLAAGGNGTGPEALLIAAVASCYSVTLSHVLERTSLPLTRVSVLADGLIADDSGKEHPTSVTVHPTIRGADTLRRGAYEKAAAAARDQCLVGRSVRGNVAYVVGRVSLQSAAT